MNLNAEFQDIDGVLFGNQATREGGSFYCTFCSIQLLRTLVRFSSAQRDGGSFWLSSSAVASLQDVFVVDSTVEQGNGGGVFLSVASSLSLQVCFPYLYFFFRPRFLVFLFAFCVSFLFFSSLFFSSLFISFHFFSFLFFLFLLFSHFSFPVSLFVCVLCLL